MAKRISLQVPVSLEPLFREAQRNKELSYVFYAGHRFNVVYDDVSNIAAQTWLQALEDMRNGRTVTMIARARPETVSFWMDMSMRERWKRILSLLTCDTATLLASYQRIPPATPQSYSTFQLDSVGDDNIHKTEDVTSCSSESEADSASADQVALNQQDHLIAPDGFVSSQEATVQTEGTAQELEEDDDLSELDSMKSQVKSLF